jgi:hypothetical protein
MGSKKTCSLPARLERLRRRFERWRGTHKARSRISEPLWASAVKMAGTYGLNRTARTLRLDYYVLKKRMQQMGIAIADLSENGATTFLELTPSLSASPCECTLDLENASGAKMRVQLKSITMPDLAALSRSFWNHHP